MNNEKKCVDSVVILSIRGVVVQMGKKVNFFTVDLYEATSNIRRDYKEIKDLLVTIIDENASEYNDLMLLDLSRDNELHYVADIFSYKENSLFMRVSSQKPSGGYLRRDYTTNVPAGVLDGASEETEGIEVYTYALLDYETGIFSIVNQQSAPGYRIINYFFAKYNENYFMEFKPIPNPDGISRIYGAEEPRISQVEIEVPVPSAETLDRMFGWRVKDILDIQGNGLKATMKLASVDRKVITDTDDETKGLIDCIKSKITDYNKAKVRARASGIKTRDYSFFDENFSYPVEIPSYKIASGRRYYFSADDLISIYRDNLQVAYNDNKELLKVISNR